MLVGEHFWRRAVDVDYLVEEGVIDIEDRELFWFAETAQEIWDGILRWYDAVGEPLGGDLTQRSAHARLQPDGLPVDHERAVAAMVNGLRMLSAPDRSRP